MKLSGKPLADPAGAGELWSALAERAGETVLVHGGGVQIDALLERLGEAVERRDGIRLTPGNQIPIVAGVLAGQVNQQLVAVLVAAGVQAVGMSLASAGMLLAEPDPGIGGRVGRVVGGDGAAVRLLVRSGYTPVVSPIGSDGSGGLLNINADDAAAGLARAIGAQRVLLLTDVPGVLDAKGNTVRSLASEEIESLVEHGTIRGGMAAKVRAAAGLADATGAEVVIGSWRDAQALLRGDDRHATRILASEGPESSGAHQHGGRER
ncbi:MAG: acetylglutamate kinase [Planctomycetota bacterium]